VRKDAAASAVVEVGAPAGAATSSASKGPDPQVIEACGACLFAALPSLPPDRMVDILEFIAAQHSGSSFNPDNTDKALEIAAFLQQRPFSVTQPGVASIARLARHALGSARGDDAGNTPEHQLWLLTSGALNTAAAIASFEGDAVKFFNAVRRDGLVRGKYLQRHYAQSAMSEHVSSPEKYTEAAAAADPDIVLDRQARAGKLSFVHVFCATLGLVVAILGGMLRYSPTYESNMRSTLGLSMPVPSREGAAWEGAPAMMADPEPPIR